MYFPYFRGRQYELLALKELAAKSLISSFVVPVIEPVKIIPALNNSLAAFQAASLPVALVLNPNVGDLTDEPQIINQLLERYVSTPNVIPAILTNESAEECLTKLNDTGIDADKVLSVLNSADSLPTYQDLFRMTGIFGVWLRKIVSFLKTDLIRKAEMRIILKMSCSPMTILIIGRMTTSGSETTLLLAVIILSLDLRHTQLQFILCILQRIIH